MNRASPEFDQPFTRPDNGADAARFLDVIVESLSAHVAILDNDGRIVAVNRAWSRFGEASEAKQDSICPGTSYIDVCRTAADEDDDARAFISGLEDVLAGRRESHQQQYACHSSTEERWYQVWVNRCEDAGKVRVIVAHQDITDLKLSEHAARRYQAEMAHLLRLGMMNEMAAGLAHELRQPLTAISNFASGSLRRITKDSESDGSLRNALEDILRQSERAADILQRMSAFVRSTDGERTPSDINSIVEDALALHHPDQDAADISIELNIHNDLPQILADPVQIQQVVLNLIRNGAEAMSVPPGTVPRRLEITTSPSRQGGITLRVTDQGPGISPEELKRIFDPFFTTKSTGMGLGLALSRSIILAHDGELHAIPNTPRGMTFQFTLPPIDGAHNAR